MVNKYIDYTVLVLLFIFSVVYFLLGTFEIGGLDDAYITYQFSKNFAETGQILWSLQDASPVYGSTTFIYTSILAFCSLLGFDIPTSSVILGAVFWALCNTVIYLILRKNNSISISSLVICMLAPLSIQVYLSYGMETSLYTFLSLLCFYFYSLDRLKLLSFCAVLLLFTRLDGILVPFLITCHYLFICQQNSLKERFWNIVNSTKYAFALFLFVCIFLYAHFDSLLPNSFYAKNYFGSEVSGLFNVTHYLELMRFHDHPILSGTLLILFLVGFTFSIFNIKQRGSLVFLWSVFYVLMFQFKGMPHSPWYYAPIIPVFYALVYYTSIKLLSFSFGKIVAKQSMKNKLYFASTVVLLVCCLFSAYIEVKNNVNRFESDFLGANTYLNEERRVMSDVILSDMNDSGMTEASVYAFEVGYLGYEIPGKVYDILGLVTPEVVDNGGYRNYSVELLEKYKPDYVVIVDTPYYLPVTKVLTSKSFLIGYEPIFTLPRIFGHNYVVYKKLENQTTLVEETIINFDLSNIEVNSQVQGFSADGSSVIAKTSGDDPFFYLHNQDIQLSGNMLLKLKVKSSESGLFEMIFDVGSGYDFENSVKLPVSKGLEFVEMYWPLNLEGNVRNIRVDILDREGEIAIEQISLINLR
ncbi:hypothetical protein AB4455_15435 [Vibrio sp. 10N.261.46.E12]|uniref:hypothetical protein n=1 Tax=unclassified Vibrio TaxID=2614977 RepID=UPI0009760D57|nr:MULTISPECIES: hypothetical protein [unclassified Vibrio]OMO32561.1 hypothetical protein BH584_16250 [Vibrio sp. 10N.261.45.E1]PMJ26039.1 hypothetical protein BCU27_00765 [Vibrio sp. 10N.286.45.B6]PML89648.1 hypothetical protein BCT66_07255 [Vibrio sp. 10N.261.49.E11]PMM69684.1 hypothetical protein BCT48_09850 [Vibrio sp. 10N.261.46.F12]PMM90718.1 hypothetical protein BCT46_01065 [Vibrio sp. 10N.261.46.E8]